MTLRDVEHTIGQQDIDIRKWVDTQLFSFRVRFTAQRENSQSVLSRVELIPAKDKDWFRWEVQGQIDQPLYDKLVKWIAAYLTGKEPPELSMVYKTTPYVSRVLDCLRHIKFGKTATYKEIAHLIGSERGYRSVAKSCSLNPLPLVIPCHRVVATGGKLGGYSTHNSLDGLKAKKELLDFEANIKGS